MSLNTALSIAMAGLRANQAALSLVSSNVANAETPGYIRKTTDQVALNAGDGSSVRTVGVNRELDQYILAQLRTEMSGAGYASLKSSYLQQMQSLYGDPGSVGSLEYSFNALTAAVQALSTSADSSSARIGVLNAAQTLAQQLNSMTQGIQNLRSAAENGIKDSVTTANNLMKQIANINNQLTANPLGGTSTDANTAALLDQRDQYINQLSQLMDIRVSTNGANQVTVFTGSGVQLVGNEAATLRFNAQGTVSAGTTWSSDPSKSALGSVMIDLPNGGSIDLTATGAIKSGMIAAYTELRDKTLVEAQNQLDQFAASISSALSDKTTVSPAPVAPATDYSLDASKLLSGNTINLTYTDAATGKQQQITLMRVDTPDVLPLSNTATTNPNDKVIGVDFSQGITGILNQINSALGGNVTFSGSSLSSLSVASNPAFATINTLSTTVTQPPGTLADGSTEFALFTDNGSAYTGGITTSGSQITGLAGRITVNNALIADPSKLVAYNSTTAAGDTTRSSFMLNQLTNASFTYGAQTGVGSAAAPFTGNLLSYMRQFVSQQGAAADAAKQLSDGQNVVLNTLDKKMSDASGVNMDDEMAHLLALQNAYSANARVMSTVNELYKTLMQAF
ncbi:flagellar hook-associated protein FlgK [Rhodopseudomonas boonkerdii]|uniref:flagellar hook-associated protein FlgK n=1 Tax=Rhodopseudomonas boonkerdii TaxID=475937 RepID=UPI001E6427BF|nr:flagellar hook-associated protein FlgK [Rhodopseudomonas boonkerdii]UGV27497.1 flagellar hook-associated protein FlgK [Rhodopseudomonas boonkerdii]